MNEAEQVTWLAGRFETSQERTFIHVPFEMPQDLTQVRIQVSYTDRIASDPTVRGGNVLDIGLFDARGTAAGGPGFRGWSGSNRTDIVIGETWATPPYVAGRLLAGTWHLLLGAYKVGPDGLDWEAKVTFDPEPVIPNLAIPPSMTRPPARAIPHRIDGWVCGDLHAHTVYSDGTGWPIEVAARAAAAGLDFYGITDHNRAQSPVSLVPHGDGWPLLVPGVEVTTYAGHFNVWGTDRWYDFRDPTPAGLQRAVDEAIADSGFVSMNHPKPFGPDWEYPEVTGFHGIEAWNGWWARMNATSTRVWEEAVRSGRSVTPLAGSDMHRIEADVVDDNPFAPPVLGYPTLWVCAGDPITVSTILDALHRGDVSMSDAPDGPQIVVEAETSGRFTVRVVRGKGNVLLTISDGVVVDTVVVADDNTVVTIAPPSAGIARFEVHGPLGAVRALSNAVPKLKA